MKPSRTDSTVMAKVRVLCVRAAIVLLTLASCFAGLEFVLNRYYSEQQPGTWSAYHPLLGWVLVPGEYWVKPPQKLTSFPIHVNDFGVRQTSLPAARPSARIVVLGDSFVFGRETPDGEMFTQRLQDLLRERVSDSIDVINAGVPSYGTAQEWLLIKELSQKHHINAEMYVLMFFTNDPLDNLCLSYGDLTPQPVRPCFTLNEEGSAMLTRLPVEKPDYEDDTIIAQRTSRAFKTISVAKAWAEEWVLTQPEVVGLLGRVGIRPQVGRMPGILNAWYRDQIVADGVPLTASLLQQMQRDVQQRGGQLVVSMVPSPFQVYPETFVPLLQKSFPGDPVVDRFTADTLPPQRLVSEMCAKAGVPFQDLLPVFLGDRKTALYLPRDGHLTRTGHKLLAETLLPFVLDHMHANGVH